jgi:hypothetical protein
MKPRTILPTAFAVAAAACLASSAPAQKPPVVDPQTLIDQCRQAGQLNPAECARWAARAQPIEQSPCPDKRAATACRSFQELMHDGDSALMNDFAHQDHVYVCFLPGDVSHTTKDEFFKVTFSDPAPASFAAPLPAQLKAGVPATALAAPGESDFAYFRAGVRDSDSSFHNLGNWIYSPDVQTDLATMRRNADFHLAHFKGPNIEITNDEWKLTETYRNDADTMTKHTVTVQLATGRFRQEFALADSGQIQAETDGRCLIAPPAVF